jgi:hypothetical protein
LEELLKKALSAPRGSVAQNEAIKSAAELFNKQEERIIMLEELFEQETKGGQ